MSTSQTPADSDAPDAPLRVVDPQLNVFALANGMDLHKTSGPPPRRVLEWFRDGLERSIVIAVEDGGGVSLTLRASRRRRGTAQEATATFREGLSGEDLKARMRTLLEECIEEANGISEDDLRPAAPPA